MLSKLKEIKKKDLYNVILFICRLHHMPPIPFNFSPSFLRLFHFPLHGILCGQHCSKGRHMKLICLPHTAPNTAHGHIYMKGNEMILKHIMVKGSMSLQTCLEGRLQGDTPSEWQQSFGLLQCGKICTLFVDNQEKSSLKWHSCTKKIRKQGQSTLYITAGEGKLSSCHSLFAAQVLLFPIDLHHNCK